MNEKSLNQDDLENLFIKYENVKNINIINYLGKINKPKQYVKFSNPHFRILNKKNNESTPFQTARTIIEIPSPFRISSNKKAYITRIPVFTTDEYAEIFKELVTPETEYITGVGHLQNYQVIIKNTPNEDVDKFLYNLIVKEMSLTVKDVEYVERILNLLVDIKNEKRVKLTKIWSNTIKDGQSIANEKISQDKLPEINEVTLQGLVYMPPSIREIRSKDEYSLHFKIRINRIKDNENQNIPSMHQANYDYINVVAFGKKALSAFEKLKQGHPVLVKGRIESSKFLKRRNVSPFQIQQLASIFQSNIDNPYISEIVSYFQKKGDTIEYPNYNVWADLIETDENKLLV